MDKRWFMKNKLFAPRAHDVFFKNQRLSIVSISRIDLIFVDWFHVYVKKIQIKLWFTNH